MLNKLIGLLESKNPVTRAIGAVVTVVGAAIFGRINKAEQDRSGKGKAVVTYVPGDMTDGEVASQGGGGGSERIPERYRRIADQAEQDRTKERKP